MTGSLSSTIRDANRWIPRGRVSTCGGAAGATGIVNGARLVGYALHNLPPCSDVFWHRVVNSRGNISLHGEHARRLQRNLLEREGIVFNGDAVDLKRFGWFGYK